MKTIVPMAGRGFRLRPHTLTIPKSLIPVAGKPIAQRLVEDIVKVSGNKVDEIAYISEDAVIMNSKIDQHIAVDNNTSIENSVIRKSIIQNETMITNAKLKNSMIGNKANFNGNNTQLEVSIGDFSEVK